MRDHKAAPTVKEYLQVRADGTLTFRCTLTSGMLACKALLNGPFGPRTKAHP